MRDLIINDSKFSVLKLKSKNVILELIPEYGARIIRYCLKNKKNDFELLYPINHLTFIKKDLLEKASFPLIPFSNRINKGNFSFRGEQIQLPLNFFPEPHAIHGHGWKKEWQISQVKDHMAVIEYEYLPAEWPFPYLARQVFELDGTNLAITIQVKNIGESLMPAGLGFHPYFIRTPNSIITAKTQKMWINDSKNIPIRPKFVREVELLSRGLYINENELDNIFSGWNHKARISWPEWKLNLLIEAKSPIDFLVIYLPAGKDFFCIEPVSHVTNAFNMIEKNSHYYGTKILKPNQTLEGQFFFKPE